MNTEKTDTNKKTALKDPRLKAFGLAVVSGVAGFFLHPEAKEIGFVPLAMVDFTAAVAFFYSL